MSAIAESLRRQRLPLLTLLTVVVAGGVTWSLVSRTSAEHLTQPDYPAAAPAIEQAEWEVEFAAGGKFGKLTNDQQKRYAVQKERAAALVQGVYDGLFLEPAQLGDAITESFSVDAARKFNIDKLGLPASATEVTTTTREARVAVDAETSNFAVSRVTVVLEATVDDRDVEVEHHSTLWLERNENEWKVIAFDLEQGPAK